jgi:hypothetical protein
LATWDSSNLADLDMARRNPDCEVKFRAAGGTFAANTDWFGKCDCLQAMRAAIIGLASAAPATSSSPPGLQFKRRA